jgi:hypothetical protein
MEIIRIILIGLGSVLAPIIIIVGFIALGIILAVTIDELFEALFNRDKHI